MLFSATARLLFLLVVVMLAQLPLRVEASVRLNLKSSFLSNILSTPAGGEEEEASDEHDPSQHSFTTGSRRQDKVKERDSSNFLRLDLSGRAHCHLLGPSSPSASSVMGDDLAANAFPTSSSSSSSSAMTPLMTTRPIIRATAGSMIPNLSVVVGADYDFSQRWYGATRLLTSLGWSRSKQSKLSSTAAVSSRNSRIGMDVDLTTDTYTDILVTDTSSIDTQNDDDDQQGYDDMYHSSPAFASSAPAAVVIGTVKSPRFLSRLLPAGWKVQAEHCLQDEREFAGQVAVDWENNEATSSPGGPSVMARIDSTGKQDVSVTVPLHQRLQVQWKVSNDITDEVPPVAVPQKGDGSGDDNEKEWWMPDIRIDALGRMETKNEAWLPSPALFGPPGGGGRVGVRLFVSRRLNWNAMGFANDGRESQTLLKLEVQAVSGGTSSSRSRSRTSVMPADTGIDTTNYLQVLQEGQYKSITTARLETCLERPLQAARLFLLQEHALDGKATAP
jgi:hypothetical protein